MFWKKQICPRCKTGRDSYILDEHSESCPYIGCWKNGKCQFYVPLEKPSKPGILKRNKNKATVYPPPKNDALCGVVEPFAVKRTLQRAFLFLNVNAREKILLLSHIEIKSCLDGIE